MVLLDSVYSRRAFLVKSRKHRYRGLQHSATHERRLENSPRCTSYSGSPSDAEVMRPRAHIVTVLSTFLNAAISPRSLSTTPEPGPSDISDSDSHSCSCGRGRTRDPEWSAPVQIGQRYFDAERRKVTQMRHCSRRSRHSLRPPASDSASVTQRSSMRVRCTIVGVSLASREDGESV